MERHAIVSHGVSGKLILSPVKLEQIHLDVAKHLDMLEREVSNGVLDEDNLFNADETHSLSSIWRTVARLLA